MELLPLSGSNLPRALLGSRTSRAIPVLDDPRPDDSPRLAPHRDYVPARCGSRGRRTGCAGAADRLPRSRSGDLHGRLRRPARPGCARGERHAGAAPRPRPRRRGRHGQVPHDLVARRLHALPRRQERHRVPLHPPQQRPHRHERQPGVVRPRRRLREGAEERRQGGGRRGDRLRRRLRRRERDPSPSPLRGASERRRGDESVPVPEQGAPPALRRPDRERRSRLR